MSRMNLYGVARLKREIFAAKQDFGINRNSLSLADQYDLPRSTLILAFGRNDSLREGQSVGPRNFWTPNVAKHPNARALRFGHLGDGLLLSRRERGLGLGSSFGSADAARERK